MTVSPPSGFDPNNPLPFIGLAVRLGVGARAVAAPRVMMLLGNIVENAITATVGSDDYVTAAGTASLATPIQVASADDADTYFGVGSELALMCRAVFAQKRGAYVWACPVAQHGSAVKATAVMLFATTATSAGSVKVTIAGRTCIEAAVASGDTASTIATAVAHAINKTPNLPVTATVSSATVTLTAKCGGTRGNAITLGVEITAGATTCGLGGATAGQKVTDRVGGGTGTDGANADDVTNALAAIAAGEYFIVAAHQDSTNIGLIKTHLNTYAGISDRKRQQAVCATSNVSVATAAALGIAINAARVQIAYQRDASSGGTVDPYTPTLGELAASVAAARLYGDAQQSGTVVGELAYAACNLDGCQLAAVQSPRLVSAHQLGSEMVTLLNAGITPLAPSALNPGFSQIVKSITTYCRTASSALTRAVHDTSKVTVADHAADRCEEAIIADFPNKNIAPEPSTPRAPPNEHVIYVSMIKSTILRELYAMEGEGLLVNVEEFEDAVELSQDGNDPTKVFIQIPTDVIDHFHTGAGEILQTG